MASESQDSGGSMSSQAFINLMRATTGMGLLTMPAAIARIGIIPAFFITVLLPFLSFFTYTWAVEIRAKRDKLSGKQKHDKSAEKHESDPLWAEEALARTPEEGSPDQSVDEEALAARRACLAGFDDVVQDVLGSFGRLSFVACVVGDLFTAGVSFLSAIVEGMQFMFPGLSQDMGLLLLCLTLMITTVLAPDLKDIAFLSFASMLVFIYMLISMPLEGMHERHKSSVQPPVLWDVSAGLLDWGFTYGAVACTYGGIGIGLCVYEDMKRKADYGWVTAAAFACTAVVSMIFGLAGNWAFGGDVNPISYLNFRAGSMESYICIVSYNLIMFATYILNMVPLNLLVRSWFPSTPYVITRLFLILLTILASKFMPSMMQVRLYFTLFSAQVAQLIIPALCYLRQGDKYNIGQQLVAYSCIATAIIGGSLGFLSAAEGEY